MTITDGDKEDPSPSLRMTLGKVSFRRLNPCASVENPHTGLKAPRLYLIDLKTGPDPDHFFEEKKSCTLLA